MRVQRILQRDVIYIYDINSTNTMTGNQLRIFFYNGRNVTQCQVVLGQSS